MSASVVAFETDRNRLEEDGGLVKSDDARPTRLGFELWDYEKGCLVPVRFEKNVDSSIALTLEGQRWDFVVEQNVSVAGICEELGVNVFLGWCVVEHARATTLIVLNCGQEPPTLQVSIRSNASVQSSSLRIDHSVQHDLVQMLLWCLDRLRDDARS